MATTDGQFVTAEGLASAMGVVGGGGATLLWSGATASTVTIGSLQDYSLIVCLLYEGGRKMTFAIGAPDGLQYLSPTSNGAASITIGPTSVRPGIFQLRHVYGIK